MRTGVIVQTGLEGQASNLSTYEMQENTGVCILLRQSYKVYPNIFQVKISMVFLVIREGFADKGVFLSLAEAVSVSRCF